MPLPALAPVDVKPSTGQWEQLSQLPEMFLRCEVGYHPKGRQSVIPALGYPDSAETSLRPCATHRLTVKGVAMVDRHLS